MRSACDPSFLTPDERLSEVAAILAAGILRLHGRRFPAPTRPGKKPPIRPHHALMSRRKPRSVSNVVDGPREPETETSKLSPETRRNGWS
jgi:hypothetical protein